MTFSLSLRHDFFTSSSSTGQSSSVPTGNLNENIQVTVYPYWYDQVSLEWKVPSSWAGARFHVYYWPGGSEGYTRLTATPTSDLFFKDTSNRDYSKAQSGGYVVEAILPFTSEVVKSQLTTWGYKRRDRIEKIANEIQRREYMLLSKFAGAKSFFFRKKVFGTRCPRCWDKETEKVMDDHCEVCYGTSFEGGYYSPIAIYIQYDPTQANKRKSYVGDIEPTNLGAWTISMPEIVSDDIIIRSKDWNVYRVIDSNPTELQTRTVRQIMSITQLSRQDIENSLKNKIQPEDSAEYLTQLHSRFNKERFPSNLVDKKPENDYDWAKGQNPVNLPSYKV